MPFGITTAPGVFQRMINKILGPLKDTMAVAYLDDILIPSKTFEEGIQRLDIILNVLRIHNLTLNPAKCHFFKTKVNFLGFEVNEEGIRPGEAKVKCIKEFPEPTNLHKVRQFVGLTSFFRQFIQGYATVARPLTQLTRKNQPWKWGDEERNSFTTLKEQLTNQPLLAIYNPNAETEVHTDASQKGLAGILLQKQESKLRPIAYYSRQTTPAEEKYHSYELETLAVVETLKKFRTYLIDKTFKVVTDCNAIKAASKKRDLVPRIARWWLLIQEFTFTIEYRPGSKMSHVDALSRNAIEDDSPIDNNEILRIEVADWVLAGQLSDEKIKEIHNILERKPNTDYEKSIHTDYCLREGRVYRKTKTGDKWIIPKEMRNQVLRACHDELGHFGVEKTLNKICENYWFPNMRKYVTRYVNNCIRCLFHKKPKGKREGFLNPIEKSSVPFHTLHMDHLGPFVRSTSGKKYLIVAVESFTKYTFIRAVKDTKTLPVLKFLEEIINLFGVPTRLITDRGTCYTSHTFKKFCDEKGIKHVRNAVATPRANGQVERFNSTILTSLAASAKDDTHWDREVNKIQFAINNTIHSVTRKTPSELLFGYNPKTPINAMISDGMLDETGRKGIENLREEAASRIKAHQEQQKKHFDSKRKPAKQYQVGDLVLVRKPIANEGQSRKLLPTYKGPFQIKRALGNDRYVIKEMPGSRRTNKTKYESVESSDHLKTWKTTKRNGSQLESSSDSEEGGES